MRALAFRIVSQLSAWTIMIFQWIGLTGSTAAGKLGYALMARIDRQKLSMYEGLLQPEGPSELEAQNLELKLLASAAQVRDHAQNTGDWTDTHSDAISAIGEALLGEIGWQEDSVHQYLREIVESIDGLEYDVES